MPTCRSHGWPMAARPALPDHRGEALPRETAVSRPDPNGQNSAGVRWRPRHQTDGLLRELSHGRGRVEGRHAPQLRRRRRGAGLHGRRGELHSAPAAAADLPILRQTPLFPGDALVDELPTLTDIYEFAVGSPARGRKLPPPASCCAPVDSTPWTASRAMRRARSAPPSTTAS